jgi:tRNA(fMet)-specific endonuclease VapC
VIILDTDIATLLSYGKTEKLKQRIAAINKGEQLSLTVITEMEMLEGRFASIKKAADREQLQAAMERFLQTERFLASFDRLNVDNTVSAHFDDLLKGKKTRKMRRTDMLIASIALARIRY